MAALDERRKALGLDHAGLRALTGVKLATLQSWQDHRRDPRVTTLIPVVEALGCSIVVRDEAACFSLADMAGVIDAISDRQKAMGLSRAQLADQAGVCSASIPRWRDRETPTLSSIVALAEVAGFEVWIRENEDAAAYLTSR